MKQTTKIVIKIKQCYFERAFYNLLKMQVTLYRFLRGWFSVFLELRFMLQSYILPA